MFRARRLSTQVFGLATAVLAANFAVAVAAFAQATAAELPAECSAYASVPLPAEAEKVPVPKTFPACASYRSYRGIGRPMNYSEARACAWQERLAQKADLSQNQKEPTAWVVGGSLILADIYFNGAGVKRDVPLALRFACEFEEGLTLADIVKLNGAPHAEGPFEFCDYASTTFTENFCSGYESEIEDDRRGRYFDSLKRSMTAEQRAAFEKLLAAQVAYVDTHAFEVYQGGTIHNIRTLRSQDILNDLFHTEVVHFERKRWPVLSEKQIAGGDALLDREYKKQLQQLAIPSKDEIEDGVVTAENVAKVQKSWEAYRDAWVAFARVRYPAAVDLIRAEVTFERYRLLKTIS